MNSLKSRIVFFVCLLIVGTIGCYVFITSHFLRKSYTENSVRAFIRTEQVVEAQISSLNENMKKQAELIGMMPVLRATIESGDLETVKDSILSYQMDFKFPVFELLSSSGKLMVSAQETFDDQSKQTQELFKNAIGGESNYSLVSAKGKVSLMAAAPVGIPDPTSVLIVGVHLDDEFSKKIKKLTNIEISVLNAGKLVSTSLPEENKGLLITQLDRLVSSNAESVIEDESLNSIIRLKEIRDSSGQVIGHFLMQQSLDELNQSIREVYLNFFLLTLVVLGLAFMGTLLLSSTVAKPIIKLKNLMESAIKTGDLSARIEVKGKDEVASLSVAFNHLLDVISSKQQQLEKYNAELESKVKERTHEVVQAKEKIEQVLNTIDQGLLMFGKDGLIHENSSKICRNMFAKEITGLHVADVLGAEQAIINDLIDSTFSEIIALKDLLYLFPDKIEINDKILKFEYKVTREDEKISGILCVVTDRTELEKLEKRNQIEVRRNAALITILSNKKDFMDVVDMTLNFETANKERAELKRHLHTLKGFYSVLGCRWLVDICHHWETQLEETADFSIAIEKAFVELKSELKSFLTDNQSILKWEADKHIIEIDKKRLVDVYGKIPLQPRRQDVFNIIDDLISVPIADELAWLNEVFVNTAHNMKKKVVPVQFKGGAKVPSGIYSDLFKSFVHIARNSADHGIEDNDARMEAGKTLPGCLTVNSMVHGDTLEIQFQDNGKGIDVEYLSTVIAKKGFQVPDNNEAIENFIFHNGFSSKQNVTETSGRGVGLDAVMTEAKKLGGTCYLKNDFGSGLMIAVKVPLIRFSETLQIDTLKIVA